MNWKNRLTNYNFWISIFSAVLLILQALKIEFDIAYVNEIFTAVLGLLVVIGIISDPTRTTVKTTEQKENTKVKNENKSLPIDEKNETNNGNIQGDTKTFLGDIDFQGIINKISVDLDEKIKELAKFNEKNEQKAAEYYVNKNIEEPICAKLEENQIQELENPYVDIIK